MDSSHGINPNMLNIPLLLLVQPQQNSTGTNASNFPFGPGTSGQLGTAMSATSTAPAPSMSQLGAALAAGPAANPLQSSSATNLAMNHSLAADPNGNASSSLVQQLLLAIAKIAEGSTGASSAGGGGSGESLLASASSGHNIIPQAPQLSFPSTTAATASTADKPSTNADDKDQLFPYILHGLLEDVERAGHGSIISWTQDGKTFKIHHRELFASKILRLYFQLNGFDQFHSQLEDWGFSLDRGAYFHPCFVRGQPLLCRHMRCSRTKEEVSCLVYPVPL